MANSWGTTAADDTNKPFWLTASEKENTYATASGWVYKQPSGNEEVLVAIRDLADTLGVPNLTGASFAAATYTASAATTFSAYYDEQITLASGTPTIAITYDGGTNPTTTAVAGEADGNGITWTFTVPAEGGVKTASATGGGTLVEGTYTNVGSAGVTNSGGGTGARFTVVVNEALAIESVVVTTAGTAYVAASTDTIDAASWAGGDAKLVIAVDSLGGTLSVAGQTIGSTAGITPGGITHTIDAASTAEVTITG